MTTDPLGNAVWHALTGPQSDRAERLGGAARFTPDLSPFAAVADPADPQAWHDLRALIGPGGDALLFAEAITWPATWERTWAATAVQMQRVASDGRPLTAPGDAPPIVSLGEDDAAEMAALVAATQPGPWAARTHTLGPYIGIRRHDRLVAMAGTRLRPAGRREISAVCTAADHRGQGLAAALISRLATEITAAGETPFLHASTANPGAIRLYATLGFEATRTVDVGRFQPRP